MEENKKKALDMAILQIEKDFGKGAVMRLGDSNAMSNVEVVPTGALTGSDYAKRKVQEEIQRYKYRMDRERTKYKVISEEVQEDGSLLWRLLESMATISQQDII